MRAGMRAWPARWPPALERGRDFALKANRPFPNNSGRRHPRSRATANAEAVKYWSRGLELVDKLPDGARAEQQIVLFRKRAVSHLALGQLKESFPITPPCEAPARPPAIWSRSAAL